MSLHCEAARLEVAPECGARLLSFDVKGRDLLRRAGNKALDKLAPYDFAGFPLMPYSGPLFGGGFFFEQRFFALERNVAAEADATHGDAWMAWWQVDQQSESRIALRMRHEPKRGSFPFHWEGELTYSLQPTSMTIDLLIRNLDHHAMPAGLGYHPYFPRKEATRLTFAHGPVWPPDSPGAVRQGPLEVEGLDFALGRDLTGLVADRCFEDWPGVAQLDYPDGHRTTITATPELGKLQLYVPWYDPYVCVEPVSNANDGFNRASHGVSRHGVVVLAPGETLEGSIRMAAGSWDV